jgi:dienelactone hydrolase
MKNFRGFAIMFSAIVTLGVNCLLTKVDTISAQPSQVQTKPTHQASKFQLPSPRGAFSVGTNSYYLVDSSRKETYRSEVYDIRTQQLITTEPKTDRRELMIQVWYPAKAQSQAITAPYIDRGFALVTAQSFGAAFGVAPDLFVKLVTQTVQTNSIHQAAPVQSKERYPVVIFSPGFGATPKWYTSQIEQLVSQGYIVVGLNPTYEAPAVFPGGRVLTQSSVFDFKSANKDVEFRTFNQATTIRVKDVSFVLNELQHLNQKDPQGLLKGRLNLSRVGIIGHSLGANTAVEAMRIEPRIKAGISMDCGEYGELFKQQSKQRLNRPLMVMSREQQEVWSQLLYERVNADAYKLRIKGSVHNTFIDFGLIFPLFALNSSESEPPMKKVLGSIEPQRAARIIDDYTLAFFNQYLKSKNNSLLRRALLRYPEVLIESKITH